jgi:hypothetical protein
MFGSQSGHVQPNLIPQRLSPRTEHIRSLDWILEAMTWPDMSGPLTYLGLTEPIRLLSRVLEAFPRHVRLPVWTYLT